MVFEQLLMGNGDIDNVLILGMLASWSEFINALRSTPEGIALLHLLFFSLPLLIGILAHEKNATRKLRKRIEGKKVTRENDQVHRGRKSDRKIEWNTGAKNRRLGVVAAKKH